MPGGDIYDEDKLNTIATGTGSGTATLADILGTRTLSPTRARAQCQGELCCGQRVEEVTCDSWLNRV